MGHNLHSKNGQACLMYVREAPWHGLGTKLDSPPTSAEAIKAAKLDWRVKKVPLYAVAEGNVAAVKNRFAVVPEDRWGKPDCPIFGVVGQGYTPLQNEDAFAFLDSIVGMKAAMYHTAGALGDGQRVWVLAKLPGEIRVVGDDISHKYLLLANGHDGNTTVQMKFTPIRVVCQNTLSWALEDGTQTIAVHHGRNFWSRLDSAKDALGIINDRFARFELEFKSMASVQMDKHGLAKYLKAVFPDPPIASGERHGRTVVNDREESTRLFETGPGNDMPKVKGTLWAAFHGVTDYLDHFRGDQTPEKRLQSVWFGRGYQIKARAYIEACKLLLASNS